HQNKPLAGTVVGRILLHYEGGATWPEKLILGENIREWSPGNFPGQLVDTITDRRVTVAFNGKNEAGKDAVIDHFQIAVPVLLQPLGLQTIEFVRDVQDGTPEGILHFS